MCGIIAGTNISNQNLIYNSLNSLIPRGPDSLGIFFNDEIFLGHTLLSIFSKQPKNATQPLLSNNKKFIGCVNGEIYNYISLKKELVDKGIEFYSNSDSEILINLFQLYGLDSLQKINGEFSFVIYDIDNKNIIAGVDRHGTKPLNYYHNNEKFYIGSTIKSLKHLEVPCELDIKNCLHSIAFQYLPVGKTLFQNIYSIPPGCIVQFSNNNINVTEYYKPKNYENTFELEKIESLLENAVINKIPNYHKLGLVLSGGIDSSLIYYYLNKNKIDFTAYSIDFEESKYSERKEIEKFCQEHNFTTTHVVLSNKEIADNFVLAVLNSENIAINPHISAKLLINKFMKNNGIKVCLTGDGADEIFYGYEHFFSDEPIQFIKDSINFGNKSFSLLNSELIDEFKHTQKILITSEAQKHYMKTWLPQYGVGMLGDSQSMNIGQEHRYPFLDFDLIDYTFSIKNFKNYNYPSKNILRMIVNKFNPRKSMIPKNPFVAPHMTLDYMPYFEEFVLTDKFISCKIYDRKNLTDYIMKLKTSEYSTGVLSQILSLGILFNKLCD